MNKIFRSSLLIMILTISGCASTPEGEAAVQGAKTGALGGAALGLFLGALTGDSDIAARAAVAGAGVGAAYGAEYGYTQAREDKRTQVLAEAIGGANKGETVEQAGMRHFHDLLGKWDLNIWFLENDGNKMSAAGQATGILSSKESARVDFSNIKIDGDDEAYAGFGVFSHSAAQGFTMYSGLDGYEVADYVGEYIAAENKFNFYYVGDKADFDDGTINSVTRVELRISGPNLWFIDTYTKVSGKEIQIQSFRFTKS